MVVVILAAGYATRLYPLTKNRPKALLEIGLKPLLDHLVDKVKPLDQLQRVVLVTNNRFARAFEEWASRREDRVKIEVLNDGTNSNEDRLGAIGDLHFAIERCGIQEDILVLASDNLFEGDLRDFVAFATSKKNAGCIGVHGLEDPEMGAKKYGIIQIDSDSRILSIEEKPDRPKSRYASMGIYYFPQSSLGHMKEYLGSVQKQDAPGFYATWLLEKMKIFAFLFPGEWYDIGSLEQLKKARSSYRA